MLHLRSLVVPLAILLGTGVSVVASELPQPQGDVVLTVTGDIGVTNDGAAAVFDLAMLEALGAEEFQTTTIWTEGVQSFTGVPLGTLMEALDVEGGTIKATAINDYAVEIPVSDAIEGGPIIAYMRNGETMSVRDKGPLWIVYPYDLKSEYRQELIYSRSIWQLDRVEVLP